jgi:hypothetical protein
VTTALSLSPLIHCLSRFNSVTLSLFAFAVRSLPFAFVDSVTTALSITVDSLPFAFQLCDSLSICFRRPFIAFRVR